MDVYKKKIQNYFPNAEPIKVLIQKNITKICAEQNIPKEKILLATSLCSDEINHNHHSFTESFRCGEFILGGITGYPFSGKAGLTAFSTHIPDGGAALIIFGPHIGISQKGKPGKVKRPFQSEETASCGALTGILEKFNEETSVTNKNTDTHNYQMEFVTRKLFEKRENIIQSTNPSIGIVKEMYHIIEKDIDEMLVSIPKVFDRTPLYILGGILINTDDGYNDYFEEAIFKKHRS